MEKGAWPRREDRKTPTDVFGTIRDELRIDHDQDLFRESLVGLMRYYGETPLAKSLHHRTDQMAFLAEVDDTPNYDVSKLVGYSGAIFGLHAAVHHLPHAKKVHIASQQLPELTPPIPYGAEDIEDFTQYYIEAYTEEFEDTIDRFNMLPGKHQRLLQQSARLACAQYGRQFESLFIRGAMTSIHYAVPLGDVRDPYRFAL